MRALTAAPYRVAITPQIAWLDLHLPREAAADVEDASEALRAFAAVPGEDAGAFSALLLRAEAASSSQIDNPTSGAAETALAELGEEAPSDAVQIVRNVAAMRVALALSGRIDTEAIRRMHAALHPDPTADHAGQWRHEQVWVGGDSLSPHNAVFVPPHHSRVEGAVVDLVAFAGRTDLPALTHAAVVHAQFETIHPFTDGNGRTGRALVHAMLRHRHVTRAVTVPISAGWLADTVGYFDSLTAYRAGDPLPIVTGMAAAARTAVTNGRQLVDDLHSARAEWVGAVRARSDSSVWPLLDLLLRHPIVSTAVVQGELGISHTNAMRSLAKLTGAGVLQEVGARRRSILWQAPQVLSALDAFAARAGRRTVGE